MHSRNSMIGRLRELTDQLSGSPMPNKTSVVEYDTGPEKTIGVSLYVGDRVAVQRAFMPKGAHFPLHVHEEKEFLVCFSGKAIFSVERTNGTVEEISVVSGDVVVFLENEPHEGTALENTHLIGITIPPTEGYPGVPS